MASRGRVALIALGAGVGVLVLFVFTVWLILAVSDDGLPGGAKVAVVEVEGVIGVGADRGLDTESIIRALGEYRDDPAVRAVVLRIDSPGGVVAPTQEIFTAVRRLREAKKPVVASLGSVAASGGYYVAVVRRPHLREPRHAHRLDRRRDAARQRGGPAQEGGRGVRRGQGGRLQGRGQLRARHDARRSGGSSSPCSTTSTTSSSPRSRKAAGSSPQAVRAFAEGRIYSGRQAHGLKMVDDLGGLEDAIEAAAKMAGLPPKPKVLYPRRRFSLRELLRNEWGLGPVSRMLPAMQTLRTPLYLMP